MKRPLPDSTSASQAYLASRNGLVEQDRDQRVPAVLGEVADRADVLDAGVGDHEVEPAEALERGVDGQLVRLAGGQVAVFEVEAEDVVAVGAQALDRGGCRCLRRRR